MLAGVKFPADRKLLRDKHGKCNGCAKKPPPGQKWSVCGGCKLQLYCSKECQMREWPTHKLLCRQTQDAFKRAEELDRERGPSDIPPLTERYAMFHDFEKIHNHAFQLAVLSMRKVADPPMDLMKMCLFFYVSYRPDNGGNPAKYFKIDNVRTETQEAFFKRVPACLEKWNNDAWARKDETTALRLAFGSNFLGHIPMYFTLDSENSFTLHYAVFKRQRSVDRQLAKEQDCPRWLEVLKSNVDRGLVLDAKEISNKGRCLGEMVLQGKSWKWRAFTTKELVALGFPPNYRSTV